MVKDENLRKYAAKKLKELRERYMTQDELAEKLSLLENKEIKRQTISLYENGERGMNQDILFDVAKIFGVPISYFFPTINNSEKSVDIKKEMVQAPILGKIPAGMPFEAIENQYTINHVEIPKSWLKGGKEYFALRLDGDSMEPVFKDGGIVVFLKSSTCESGQYCCVRINGCDATFKKVQIQENGIILSPLNENNSTGFKTTFYTKEQIDELPVEILGIAKRYIGDIE